MLKRPLAAVLGALLLVAAAPLPAEAAVSDVPTAGFPSFNGPVDVISHRGNTIFVGGSFTRVTDANGAVKRLRAVAINARTMLVKPWNPKVKGGAVHEITWSKKGVYLGGEFTKVTGKAHQHIALVNKKTGKAIKAFNVATDGVVNTIAVSTERVYFGGDFTMVGDVLRHRAAAVGVAKPYRLTNWNPDAQTGPVNEIALTDTFVYLGGEFRAVAGDADHQRLVRVTPTRGAFDDTWDTTAHFVINDIEVSGNTVYAGQAGPAGGGVYAYDTTTGLDRWTPVVGTDGRRFNGDVMDLKVLGSDVYVVGHFTNICAPMDTQGAGGACTNTTTRDIRWGGATLDTATGGTTAWNPRFAGNGVEADAVDALKGGSIAAGGNYTLVNMPQVPLERFGVFAPPA